MIEPRGALTSARLGSAATVLSIAATALSRSVSPTITASIGPAASKGAKKRSNSSGVALAISSRSAGRQRASPLWLKLLNSRPARAEAEEKLS
jgi:hypothetical protein